MLGESALDGHRRLHGIDATVETDEEPVAGVADLSAIVLGEGCPERTVMPGEQGLPFLVSHQADQIGGGDDVGEHEGLGHPGTILSGAPRMAARIRLDLSDVESGAQTSRKPIGRRRAPYAPPPRRRWRGGPGLATSGPERSRTGIRFRAMTRQARSSSRMAAVGRLRASNNDPRAVRAIDSNAGRWYSAASRSNSSVATRAVSTSSLTSATSTWAGRSRDLDSRSNDGPSRCSSRVD